jgi:transcriptional regulator with XRE-family HTH domain
MTQLELALDAGISARHLSFVEKGRSKPGREMLLRVLEQLKVPFREQNGSCRGGSRPGLSGTLA